MRGIPYSFHLSMLSFNVITCSYHALIHCDSFLRVHAHPLLSFGLSSQAYHHTQSMWNWPLKILSCIGSGLPPSNSKRPLRAGGLGTAAAGGAGAGGGAGTSGAGSLAAVLRERVWALAIVLPAPAETEVRWARVRRFSDQLKPSA